MNFREAIELTKQGLLVSRNGWNNKGMFIFIRPADELSIDFIVDKIKSLPQSMKTCYLQDITNEEGYRVPIGESDVVKFTTYLCMKAADGAIVNSWLTSQTDILAEDWIEFK